MTSSFCIDPHRVTWLGIDLQARLLPSIHGANDVVASANKLLKGAELLSIPVVLTEHCPEKLGATDRRVHTDCARVVTKPYFDATRSHAASVLSPNKQAVVFGCETHVCVLQTVAGLLQADDLTVFVVSDACGSQAPENHRLALERMRAWGVSIVTTDMVLFEAVKRPDHPQFRSILSLIKS